MKRKDASMILEVILCLGVKNFSDFARNAGDMGDLNEILRNIFGGGF